MTHIRNIVSLAPVPACPGTHANPGFWQPRSVPESLGILDNSLNRILWPFLCGTLPLARCLKKKTHYSSIPFVAEYYSFPWPHSRCYLPALGACMMGAVLIRILFKVRRSLSAEPDRQPPEPNRSLSLSPSLSTVPFNLLLWIISRKKKMNVLLEYDFVEVCRDKSKLSRKPNW